MVECFGLKPCCVSESGIDGLMLSRTRRSRILDGLQRSEMGRYEVASVGGLFGFRIGMILAVFH